MTAATHWAAIEETTFVAGIRVLWWAYRWLGRAPFRALLWPVVAWMFVTQPGARRASRAYLQRVAPQRAPSRIDVLRHFAAFGETLLDKLLATSGHYAFHRVRQDGELPPATGGVIVTAHIGCLELCQALAERRGDMALKVLVHTKHAQRFNALLRRLNPAGTIELLQVSEVDASLAARLGAFVEGGGWIAIAGDRVPLQPSKTVTLPFLGEPAPFPVGAYVLAALWRCPLVFMACYRQGNGHRLVVRTLAERVNLPRAQRQAGIEALASRYAALLEQVLGVAPLEWFNFFDFWAPPLARIK